MTRTGTERYAGHAVWDQLRLKLDSLAAARFDDEDQEQERRDVVEWLESALQAKAPRQPSLYLTALDQLSSALNQLPVDQSGFRQFVSLRNHNGQPYQAVVQALRALPPPPPKALAQGYIDLLDAEVEARVERLDAYERRIRECEDSIELRKRELDTISKKVAEHHRVIESQQERLRLIIDSATTESKEAWSSSLAEWEAERRKDADQHNREALEQVGTLAAVASAGAALAEHAAGDLSAADWSGRGKRERRAAQWMRAAAGAAFIFAGAVGFFIVWEAISINFDLSLGGGVLRASVAVVIGAFGTLLLRESGRHFREADTAEDVALSMKALAPFYANADESDRRSARVQVGDAILVKNVLSRFSHRDAAKHGADINTAGLPELVSEAAKVLKLPSDSQAPRA